MESEIRVVKPFKGLVSGKLSPLIKDIERPSVRLSPLDLEGNEYGVERVYPTTDHHIELQKSTQAN